MKMDERTERVVEMYSKYPFPLAASKHVETFFHKYVVPALRQLQKEGGIRRVLEAGCGTGHMTTQMAECLPDAEITAVDITEGSLELAKKLADERGLKNLTFKRSNLMEFDSSLGKFDFIYSQGVIHHLSEPSAGMHNLNRYLKAGGYAFIWLYALLGRTRVLEMREALKILGVDRLAWEKKMEMALAARPLFLSKPLTLPRKLIKVLEYVDENGFKGLVPYLYGYLRKAPGGVNSTVYREVHTADYILHPQDKYYRVGEAMDLFEKSGFELVSILQGMSNSIEEAFGTDNKLMAGRKFSQREAYTLIELHEQPEGIGYFVRKTREQA
jgi:ubiquinone/menaquinone biosynthesis C-methylase UbiE